MNSKSASIKKRTVVIVGGGITGLAAAFKLEQLQKSSQPKDVLEIILLESSHRTGGKIISEHIDGFIVDGGADIFMAGKPGVVELCRALGIESEIISTNQEHRKTYIRESSSFELKQITMYDGEPLSTFKGGMEFLPMAVAKALESTQIQLNCRVTKIEALNSHVKDDSKFRVTWQSEAETESAEVDAIIITTPSKVTGDLLTSILPDPHQYFSGISYTTTATVSAAFNASDIPPGTDLDGYGYIVRGQSEAGQISASTWSSSKIGGRAPDGKILLRAFVKGSAGTDEEFIKAATNEFAGTLGIKASPLFTKIFRWPEAIAVYNESHPDKIASLDKTLQTTPFLYIAGSTIRGSGIPDSISNAFQVAEALCDGLMQGKEPQRPVHFGFATESSHFARR